MICLFIVQLINVNCLLAFSIGGIHKSKLRCGHMILVVMALYHMSVQHKRIIFAGFFSVTIYVCAWPGLRWSHFGDKKKKKSNKKVFKISLSYEPIFMQHLMSCGQLYIQLEAGRKSENSQNAFCTLTCGILNHSLQKILFVQHVLGTYLHK